MSKYAIVKLGGFQYTVEEGKEYTVPKFQAEEKKKLDVSDVLAVGTEKDLKVGTPIVKGAKVTLDILEQAKGKKITTRVFKAKSRYRKTKGFRKQVTKFKVAKIA